MLHEIEIVPWHRLVSERQELKEHYCNLSAATVFYTSPSDHSHYIFIACEDINCVLNRCQEIKC